VDGTKGKLYFERIDVFAIDDKQLWPTATIQETPTIKFDHNEFAIIKDNSKYVQNTNRALKIDKVIWTNFNQVAKITEATQIDWLTFCHHYFSQNVGPYSSIRCYLKKYDKSSNKLILGLYSWNLAKAFDAFLLKYIKQILFKNENFNHNHIVTENIMVTPNAEKIICMKRSKEVDYYPSRWSISYEEGPHFFLDYYLSTMNWTNSDLNDTDLNASNLKTIFDPTNLFHIIAIRGYFAEFYNDPIKIPDYMDKKSLDKAKQEFKDKVKKYILNKDYGVKKVRLLKILRHKRTLGLLPILLIELNFVPKIKKDGTVIPWQPAQSEIEKIQLLPFAQGNLKKHFKKFHMNPLSKQKYPKKSEYHPTNIDRIKTLMEHYNKKFLKSLMAFYEDNFFREPDPRDLHKWFNTIAAVGSLILVIVTIISLLRTF